MQIVTHKSHKLTFSRILSSFLSAILKPVFFVYNGFKVSTFQGPKRLALRELQVPDPAPHVLGLISSIRNVKHLTESCLKNLIVT